MIQNFHLAMDYILKNEGLVFTNDPKDSGGATKFGVTKAAYEQFLGHSVAVEEIQNLTLEKAKQFYFECYWMPMRCWAIEKAPIAICLFDTAVLYGPWFASHTAQVVANKHGGNLKLDGVLGDKSTAAINQVSVGNFLMGYHVCILERINLVIKNSPKNERFRRGWTRRADRLLSLVQPQTKEG